jgi:Xaa-Pro dipeptidase
MDYQNRITKLRRKMAEAGIDRLILNNPSNLYYLTGIWPWPMERFFVLILGQRDAKLVVNKLIPVEFPGNKGIEDIETLFHADWDDWPGAVAMHLGDNETVGLDRTVGIDTAFELFGRKPKTRFVDGTRPMDDLRLIKEPEEIELMRASSKINDAIIKGLIESISPELTELQLGRRFVELANSLGSDPVSAGGGISYGLNSADPHHSQDNSRLQPGENILMDIGVPYQRYHSDMTRTVFYKEPKGRQRKMYGAVLKAQLAAIESIKPGTPFKEIDAAARKVIEAEGFGEYFIHRVGHCIGLDIHEPPYVAGNNPRPLAPGMIFSVEPGIYIPGEGAVRIEDLVVVTETGAEVLNHYPKELQVVS